MPGGFYYTGRSTKLTHEGKDYVNAETYKQMSPDERKGVSTFDKPIAGMDATTARHLIEQSNLHSFRVGDDDLAEKLTTPEAPLQSTSQEAAPTSEKK